MTHTYKVGDKGKTRGGDDYEVTAVGSNRMLVMLKQTGPHDSVYRINGEFAGVEVRDMDGADAEHFRLIPPKRRIQGWVNFFDNAPCEGPFGTKAEAGSSYNVTVCCTKAQGKEPVARIACKYIDIEEGEGL